MIYLDNQASTQCDPRVIELMVLYLQNMYGNAHASNVRAFLLQDHINAAREKIAHAIGADVSEIIFTSGATESNNIAIKGISRFYKSAKKNRIIVSTIEHKCVLQSCHALINEGFVIDYVPTDATGIVDINVLEKLIADDVILVSIMAVNNEIGTIQPLDKISAICQKYNVLFHTDAAQAIGKIHIDVKTMNIAAMSISGHKIYGPQGIGALYMRRKPRVRAEPIIHGGGQERGVRSGTIPVFLAAGFGLACELAIHEMEKDNKHAEKLRDLFFDRIKDLPGVSVNGCMNNRIAQNINISFYGVEGEALMFGLREIALSTGSACNSELLQSSHVLEAIGLPDELVHTSVRIGTGRFTKHEEIEYFANKLIIVINKMRSLSPVWDMYQEKINAL